MTLRTWGFPLAAAFLATVAVSDTPAAGAGCVAVRPADLPNPARWLGACVAGRAEGMGVLRAGTAAPYAFFAGRMHAGRAGAGLVILRNGLFEPAAGFDTRGRPIQTDSLHPEQQDQLFKLAAQAARATADRFRQANNRSSADYYRALALRIENGLPE